MADDNRGQAAFAYNGEPVGAGMFTDISEGVTELVGIATLEAFRRQGIATALTAYMTLTAFRQGATLIFLIAGNVVGVRVPSILTEERHLIAL